MKLIFLFLLYSLQARATVPVAPAGVSCGELFQQVKEMLQEQARDPGGRLFAPANEPLIRFQQHLGRTRPTGEPFRESHFGAFSGIPRGALQAAVERVRAAGGEIRVWNEKTPAFGVSGEGKPFLLLMEGMNEASLAHEMAHFDHWLEIKEGLPKELSPRTAALRAYDAMNTPEGIVVSESRAILAELAALERMELIPHEESELMGMLNYPVFTALQETYALGRRLNASDLGDRLPHRRDIRLSLQNSRERIIDAMIERRAHLKPSLRFPEDFLAPADIELYRSMPDWETIVKTFRNRVRLYRPTR